MTENLNIIQDWADSLHPTQSELAASGKTALTFEQAEATLQSIAGMFHNVKGFYSGWRRLRRGMEPEHIEALARGIDTLWLLEKEPLVRAQYIQVCDSLNPANPSHHPLIQEVFAVNYYGKTPDPKLFQEFFGNTVYDKTRRLCGQLAEFGLRYRNARPHIEVESSILTRSPFNLDGRLDTYFSMAGIRINGNDGRDYGISYERGSDKNAPRRDISMCLLFDLEPDVWEKLKPFTADRIRLSSLTDYGTPDREDPRIREVVLKAHPTAREICTLVDRLGEKNRGVNIETMAFINVPRIVYDAVGLPPQKVGYQHG